MTDIPIPPFIIIGENIHATRVVLRSGPRVAALPGGIVGLPFTDESGTPQVLPIPQGAWEGPDGPRQKVKHVKAALLAGQSSDSVQANLGRGYLRSLARRQAEAGARFLDLNVDEVAADIAGRIAAMRWLVRVIEDATDVPLALDSSSEDVLRAGLAAYTRGDSTPLLNSAAHDRLGVLDIAAAEACSVVLSATSANGMPADAAERIANARALIDAALTRGLGPRDLYVDALVIPIAVNPEAGTAFLEAVRGLRTAFGPELHLTGGLSNVSFGLPARKLINDVFIDLAASAGADSGIIDPVASDPRRIFAQDRAAAPYRLAQDLLTGTDAYGAEFLMAFRAGELS